MENVRQHEKEITSYALKRLQEIEEVEIIGPSSSDRRGGLIAFALDSVHPHDIGTFLDREGIALRAGHHCAMPMHRKLGLSASARASFYVYNDNEDVDTLISGLKKTINYCGNAHQRRT